MPTSSTQNLAAFAMLTALACTPAAAAEPPGYTLARQGDMHDFDFLGGAWTTVQRRLKARNTGSRDWEEFPAILCLTQYLDGIANVDELHMPTLGRRGLTLRAFDTQKRQWSIYWVSSPSGRLDPIPVVGGFQGGRGEFYGEDKDGDKPVKVRFIWESLDRDHARWAQAFSYDDKTWETNWTAEFTRADPARLCDQGRPRRS
ncbi:hypothetical protein [Pelomonas sp. Root1237]|uniref:hypothetical protein n=1 Tax=Pelomonas sp. Root1237 TaxID=1736434 RepID=UPI000AEC21D2|nr:hypothetical protein [Pelomonas sp. Root1237]